MSSRSKKIVGGIVGFLVTFAAGVAVAAILLSTSISGQASVTNVPGTGSGGNGGGVANKVSVDVDANAANGSNLDCSDITVSEDSTTLTFNPKLSKPAANGGNASTQPIQGGECTIMINVKNTGDVALAVGAANLNLPGGWIVGATTGLDRTIPSGGNQRLTAVITATEAAQPGSVTGTLEYRG
ncbi:MULTISPECIES: hypothetical protein [Pseudonocardia]|uniref:Uncharacterized protein n=2 Tax=Pseudonocardia TaxID=1847 RepID=A0A1Y2MNT3_PSEAH|nr:MULTISPECIES: hypothetical protein [Pseudonocardia]OSY36337.1 hypothetical protein BG845_05414 [Pseudonocardia autotrophica]TDN72705.1 alpha-galactosidase-like protein [Pseudonocardia autotrophica]BBG03418.1 hypothetical protein Pdca_46270 [Pseudonocardia autotrophica]GEC27227.1 hypothetical protein PSA01_42560 [Pseudonocardia saturnea]